jgi:integrase
MSLWKRGKTWWADVTVNGTRYRESLQTEDKREARNLEKELVGRIQAGRIATAAGKAFARIPFKQAADLYLSERERRVSERTIQFEKERLAPLRKHFADKPVGRITAADIAGYQQARVKKGISGRTVNMEVGIVRRMLAKAKLWHLVAEDVARFPEASHIGRALTVEEKQRLFKTAGTKAEWLVAHCAAVLAASTTCRGVELKNLQWKHADLFSKVLNIARSKNASGLRTIPLNADAMAALARLRMRAEALGAADPEHYVFPACEHGHTDPTRHQKSWRSAWRSLTTKAGLKGFRFHDLRHTAITELSEAGAPDATLMAIAGHMSRRMLEHYSHVRMQAKRDALDKLSTGLMGRPNGDTDAVLPRA